MYIKHLQKYYDAYKESIYSDFTFEKVEMFFFDVKELSLVCDISVNNKHSIFRVVKTYFDNFFHEEFKKYKNHVDCSFYIQSFSEKLKLLTRTDYHRVLDYNLEKANSSLGFSKETSCFHLIQFYNKLSCSILLNREKRYSKRKNQEYKNPELWHEYFIFGNKTSALIKHGANDSDNQKEVRDVFFKYTNVPNRELKYKYIRKVCKCCHRYTEQYDYLRVHINKNYDRYNKADLYLKRIKDPDYSIHIDLKFVIEILAYTSIMDLLSFKSLNKNWCKYHKDRTLKLFKDGKLIQSRLYIQRKLKKNGLTIDEIDIEEMKRYKHMKCHPSNLGLSKFDSLIRNRKKVIESL